MEQIADDPTHEPVSAGDIAIVGPTDGQDRWPDERDAASALGPRFVRRRWPSVQARIHVGPGLDERVFQEGTAGLERAFPGRRLLRRREVALAWPALGGRAWTRLQFAIDAVMLAAAVALAAGAAQGAADPFDPIWLFPLLALWVMWLRGTYGDPHWRSVADLLGRAFLAVSLATMVQVTLMSFAGIDHRATLGLWLFSAALVCAGRAALLLTQRWTCRAGRVASRALIVGAGEVSSKVVRYLREHPEFGIAPVGKLEVHPCIDDGQRVPVLGRPADMVEAARAARAEHVILAFSSAPDRALLTQVRGCQAAGMKVSVVPRLFETLNERAKVSRLGTLPIVSLYGVDPKGWQFRLKYVLDRLIAAVALVALLPLFLVITISVKLTSRGPVIFRQRRVGLDGRVFDLLKFRSMRGLRADDEEGAFAPQAGLAPGGIEGVDRRTAVGRLLRRTSLDELPQLINVLRGDMSIVGPRPERPEYVVRFESEITRYDDRHRAKSGITGLAQVHGLRGQTSLAERIEFDNRYIDSWSLGMDLKIMLRTVPAVLAHRPD